MTRRTKQILLMALVVVVAVIAGGSLYIYMWLDKSVPLTSGTVVVEGLESRVEITYDKMGIPQIWAKSERDGFFALGYVHASDRMFQMDMARRMAEGRLSEVLGEVTLEMDKTQRRVGHHRMALKALENLSDTNRLRLEAYADGVNAYNKISGAPPFEYLLLGGTFEDWTVVDCLALLSFQTWYSDALQNHDNFYNELKETIGQEKAASLCYTYPSWAPVTVPESKKIGNVDSVSIKKFGAFDISDGMSSYLMSNSSNAWAIGPQKSESGSAILCSDPHLQINQLPQFWYLLGLHIQESNLNAIGITTPGLPFVIMGHNGRAAWAFTAGGIHVTQYYTEKINPDDAGQYQTPDGWRDFEIVTDTILVSGSDSQVVLNTKVTRHGPVLDDTKKTMSLCWAGFDADINLAARSGFDLMQVENFQSFRKIVTSLGALNANWVYADAGGNIGYQLGTPIPVRNYQNDCFALDGSTDEFEWNGYYSLEKTPHSFNPAQNWLATSNNLASRSPEFAQVTGAFAADRILRITELLSAQEKISADNCRCFQLDRTDSYLLRWRGAVAKQLIALGHQGLADSISSWNGATSTESRETAIIMLFISQLRKLTFQDELGGMYKGVRTIWLDEIYNNDTLAFWFDDTSTDSIESKNDITLRAVSNAFEILSNKSWGDINSLSMNHPMSQVPVLGGLLGLTYGPWKWPGTAGTLNASYIVSRNDSTFETIVGPSWRFIIDFENVDRALFVLPAGNSGNPKSPHFFDFNQMWREGKYWNVPISKEKVAIGTVGSLLLTSEAPIEKN